MKILKTNSSEKYEENNGKQNIQEIIVRSEQLLANIETKQDFRKSLLTKRLKRGLKQQQVGRF